MSDVFVSYDRSEAPHAQAAAHALRSLGHEVWLDDQLPAHRAYRKVIQEQVTAAKAVLVLWSSEAAGSEWVMSEAERALEARQLVQGTLDGTRPPMPFDQTQCADLSGWTGDVDSPGWRKIVASVGDLVGRDRQAADSPSSKLLRVTSTSSSTVRSQRIFFVATLALAFVAAATWYGLSHRPNAAGAAHVGQAPLGATAFANRPAIAVLPFENMSEDPKHALFADGLAEDLITRLSAWRAFPVIARASSFRYRGDFDATEAAKQLGARYVVRGSVRRTPDRIRVNVQLADAQSGAVLWIQTYDRPLADVFDMQDEISTAIAAPLVGDLTRAEANIAKRRGTRNVDAWSAYQLGEQHLSKLTRDDIAAARSFYEQAISIEPHFASPYAGLAYAYFWDAQLLPTPPQETLELAVKSARRAIELDPLDSYGYNALGSVLLVKKDTRDGRKAVERAIELNPSLPVGWSNVGYAKWLAGDPQGAIEAVERAIRLSPSDPYTWAFHETLSEANWELGQFERGLDHAHAVVAGNPEYYWGYIDVAMNAVGLGQLDVARRAVADARRVQPALSLALIEERSSMTRPEIIARRAEALREAGLN